MVWLKDKKKLAIVCSLVAAIAVVAGVFIAISNGVFSKQSPATDTATSTTTPSAAPQVAGNVAPAVPAAQSDAVIKPAMKQPAHKPNKPKVLKTVKPPVAIAAVQPGAAAKPGNPPVTPGAPAVPGAPGAPGTTAPLDVANGPDPFKVPQPLPDKSLQTATTRGVSSLPQIPSPFLSTWQPPKPPAPPVAPNPVASTSSLLAGRRMAGVLYGNGVYAILETNGKSQAVQPGDTVDGGKIISIEADGITLKTLDDKVIKIPMSSSTTPSQGGGVTNGGGGSAAPRPTVPTAPSGPPAPGKNPFGGGRPPGA